MDSLFKVLVWDVYTKKVVAFLLTFFAISPGGFLGRVVLKIVVHYSEKLYPLVKQFIQVETIQLKNTIHQKIYEKAQYKLKVIAIEKGIDSKEFKDAREIEHNKLYNIVIFNP